MTVSAQREWTILLYTMADDTALRGFANQTLLDIGRASAEAGSAVKTVAQVTLRHNLCHPIRRYDFEEKSAPMRHIDKAVNLEFLACKDKNPRRNLVEFLRWGQRTYPAKRTCVVLQGHAWGADYTIPAFKLTRPMPVRGRRNDYHLILGSPRSKNHLSNKDLQDTLTCACAGFKFDLLGMDSCLMSMAEILYELHGCADYTVAPEGLGPVRGWPFYPILMKLNRDPSLGPAALGTAILDLYARNYKDWGKGVKLTASLCALEFAGELMIAMQALVPALRSGLRAASTRQAIIHARVACSFFRIPTYVDLVHFCQLLEREPAIRYGSDGAGSNGAGSEIYKACGQVQAALHKRFVQRVALQRGDRDAHGVSIYFPKWRIGAKARPSPWKRIAWTDPMATPVSYDEAVAKIDAAYINHQFADGCGWKEFLLEFLQARLVP